MNQEHKRHLDVLKTRMPQQEHARPPRRPEDEVLQHKNYEAQKMETQTCTVIDPNQAWTLRFDDSKSKHGVGAGIELISPNGETYMAAYT